MREIIAKIIKTAHTQENLPVFSISLRYSEDSVKSLSSWAEVESSFARKSALTRSVSFVFSSVFDTMIPISVPFSNFLTIVPLSVL